MSISRGTTEIIGCFLHQHLNSNFFYWTSLIRITRSANKCRYKCGYLSWGRWTACSKWWDGIERRGGVGGTVSMRSINYRYSQVHLQSGWWIGWPCKPLCDIRYCMPEGIGNWYTEVDEDRDRELSSIVFIAVQVLSGGWKIGKMWELAGPSKREQWPYIILYEMSHII